MAQICVKCGKKIGVFSDPPITLQNNDVLCSNCSASLKEKIDYIEKINTLDEYLAWHDDLVQYCTDTFGDNIASHLDNIIRVQTSTLWQLEEKFKKFEKEKRLKRNLLMTTGHDFCGYRIVKYVGIVSGQTVLGTGFLAELNANNADFFGKESNRFEDKLEAAKNTAVEKMIIKSVNQGGNALIGVDFDYIIFQNNMIGVVANGTSVIVEPSHS